MNKLEILLDELMEKRKSKLEDMEIMLNKAKELGQEQEIKEVRDRWESEEVNSLIKSYIELDKLKATVSRYYELKEEVINLLEKKIGVNGSFKDEEGIIYQIQKVTGKFVSFNEFDIVRTKKDNEIRGGLAQTKALEFGFSEKIGNIEFKKAFENQ